MVLSQLGDDDRVFRFGYRQSYKVLKVTAKKTGTGSNLTTGSVHGVSHVVLDLGDHFG